MPTIFKKNIKKSTQNTIAFGDTDVFPFPFENLMMRRKPAEYVGVIEEMTKDFKKFFENYPPQFESSLVPAGYQGYRWATQICPFWNTYLLSSLARFSKEIEDSRVPTALNRVHSYRVDNTSPPDSENLFSTNYNWRSFMLESLEQAKNSKYVVITDISEFYRRLYHHRIENSLEQIISGDTPDNIMKILNVFSRGSSYGIPIGGPAARIISEIVINQIDVLLASKRIRACRFADDFHLFTDSEEDSYRAIQSLSEMLILNQGLTLQKSKTRIMPAAEFVASFPKHLIPGSTPDTDRERLFSMSLNYDPYSPTAEQDYEALKSSLGEIDFLSLLNDELQKSQVHSPTIIKLIKALRLTGGRVRANAIKTIFDNISILYPVFSSLMIVIDGIINDLDQPEKDLICNKLIELAEGGSYILGLDIHKSFAVRVLRRVNDHRVSAIFTAWFETGPQFLKRDIIIALVCNNNWLQLSDIKNRITGESPWVRRALIVASYSLGDEGKHWREKLNLTPFELFVRDAAADLKSSSELELLM